MAILIDDMTRPTKSHQYVKPVLNIIKKAKIKSDNIRFIMASGSHGPFGTRSGVSVFSSGLSDSGAGRLSRDTTRAARSTGATFEGRTSYCRPLV